MISAETLDSAVTEGVITAQQRDRLYALERGNPFTTEGDAESDEENLRLIGGGNDLFVTVGTVLLTAGFYFVLHTLLPGQRLQSRSGVQQFVSCQLACEVCNCAKVLVELFAGL